MVGAELRKARNPCDPGAEERSAQRRLAQCFARRALARGIQGRLEDRASPSHGIPGLENPLIMNRTDGSDFRRGDLQIDSNGLLVNMGRPVIGEGGPVTVPLGEFFHSRRLTVKV